MPRKNRKKQRKEERRKAMQRVRQEKGWQPQPEIEFVDDELTRDLLTYLPELAGDDLPDRATAEALTDAVIASYDLAEEPEFQELWFHPLEVIDVYGQVEEERGVTEEMLDSLTEEEEDDLFFELLAEIVDRTLSEQLKEDILEAVEAAWKRVRLEGDQEKAGRLASMLLVLGPDGVEDVWPEVGLVLAILSRSIDVGFEMATLIEAAEAEAMDPRERRERERVDRLQAALEAVVARYPGLAAVMTREDDALWDESLEALTEGELYIGLFRQEEVEQGFQILGAETPDEAEQSDEEASRARIQALEGYISGLLTLERRAEMREQLATILEDEELAGVWAPFLSTMLYQMDDEEPDHALYFLTAAMFGEIANWAADDDDDDDNGDGEDED